MDFFFLRFSGEHESDTRVMWSVKKNRSYSIAFLFHSAHLTLTSAYFKDAKKKRLEILKKHAYF